MEKATIAISENTCKEANMLKAKFSIKEGKALSWEEFFELLLKRERKKKDLASWLYTLGIFVAITFIFTFPLIYFLVSLTAIAMILLCLLIGVIVAFFSAYILTPWSLWTEMKHFNDAPLQVLKSLEELSRRAGIKKVPKLMIKETPEINACSYASLFGNRVSVTKGLMDAYQNGKVEEEELNAILGHELGHIRNRDCLRSELVLSWISLFDLGNWYYWFFIGFLRGKRGFRLLMAIATYYPFIIPGFIMKLISKIASIPAFHLSRREEYAADEIGAELTSPEITASALKKIENLNNELVAEQISLLPYSDRWQLQPRNTSRIDRLFDTHPPMEKRISALRRIDEFI